MEVFLLHHIHLIDDVEDIKVIGVYSTRMNAEAAIGRLAQQPGFMDVLEGFEISEISIDKDHWTEGYITVSPLETDSNDDL